MSTEISNPFEITNPVIVNKVKITKPTIAATGMTSYEEIKASKNALFIDKSHEELGFVYKQIFNAEPNAAFVNSSKEEKRITCINALTFQLEFTQNVESSDEIEDSSSLLGYFLMGRVSNSSRQKYFWQTTTLAFCEANGIKDGFNFSESLVKKNFVTYIVRNNTTTLQMPQLTTTGLITLEPKRSGKGGDVLLLNNKLIFQFTTLVVRPTTDIQASLAGFRANELKNNAEFKHDDVIPADSVPVAVKQGALFNAEFQEWLQNQYAVRNLGMLTEINA